MSLRLVILSVAGAMSLPASTVEIFSQDAGLIPNISVQWSESDSTPAICLGRPSWFISIVPASVGLEAVKEPRLHFGKESRESKVIYLDPHQRLCLIECVTERGDLEPVALASPGSFRRGKILNCRSGKETCRSTIAGKERTYFGETLPMPLLRVRVEDGQHFCHPGMPLFNPEGELAGILTERTLATPEEAHAIPASQLRKLIDEFERFQKSGNVRIGVLFHEKTSTPEVLEIRPDSPAEKGGIEVGDIILKVSENEVKTLDELADFCSEMTAGRETKITVLRGLERIDLVIVPEFSKNE